MADDNSASATGADAGVTPERREAARKRQQLFKILGGVSAVLLVLVLLWVVLIASRSVSTDDAYVGADVAQVAPLVGGAIKSVNVSETQSVKAGEVLVQLDSADTQLNYQRAEAQYESMVRKVRGENATADALSAQVGARTADLSRAQAEMQMMATNVAKAKLDYDRRQGLAGTGAVSEEEVSTAKAAYDAARSNLNAAQAASAQAEAGRKAAASQLIAQQVMVEGSEASNPEVAAARAARDAAKLDLDRTVIRAPVDGVVSRRTVELGQRVQPGTPLMSIVPVNALYVDANFKEVQLKKVQIGQSVELESDLYGGGAKYHGKVIGIGGGTGSAFAIIPAQNATGNWIKVVQRLPVRIALDSEDLKAHPLRLGLSMKAKIDVAHRVQPQAGS